jgi:hypothetical protein
LAADEVRGLSCWRRSQSDQETDPKGKSMHLVM